MMLFLSGFSFLSAADLSDSLLIRLDRIVRERAVYGKERAARIDALNQQLSYTGDNKLRYELYGKLFTEYHSFNTDSSLYVARERFRIASELKNPVYLDDSRMNIAEIMGTTGMFKEALDLMKSVDRSRLPDYLLGNYYHLYRSMYGLLADYAVADVEKEKYLALTDIYRDSLLWVNPPGSTTHKIVLADRLNIQGKYAEAIQLMSDYYHEYPEDEHVNAVVTYTLSESFRLKGDRELEKKYLILSSMWDLKSAVREYISLRKLAVLLYQEGQIDRAYTYLKCAMEDAILCNARLRLLEILEIFPLVNQAYQDKVEKQQKQMEVSLILISILSVCLLLAIFYVYRQMKKLSLARREVVNANDRLKELINELHLSNDALKETNHTLSEISYIKETYIGRYMDLCSVYLDKIETYRRSLGKIALSGKVEELYKAIKSTRFIEEELKDFYTRFDETFLHLFPTFVDEFNNLLLENERIQLKSGERLNTELRIFALVRLGISDSTKIARFLRYSVTTIYNYRTKMRNKAAGERDEFEKKVLRIGKNPG